MDPKLLELAIEIAVRNHKGVPDKVGMPYILHPLRVMMKVRTIPQKIVAVLHDVVEDTECKVEDLVAAGFPAEVLDALALVTKDEGEDTSTMEGYLAFVARAAANPISRAVKLADIEDNMDLTRMNSLSEKDVARLERYQAAHAFLMSKVE